MSKNPPARRRSTLSRGAGAPDGPSSLSRVREQDGYTAKLVCTAGPLSGNEFLLQAGELVIGRASENAVSIPDTSVSRRHTVIKRRDEGWTATDLGSGNGTLVNGDAITEETLLRNGDLLVLGDTELRFVDVANNTNKVPLVARRMSLDGSVGVPSSIRPRRRTHAGNPEDTRARRRFFVGAGIIFVVLVGSLWAAKSVQTSRLTQQRRDEASRQREVDEAATLFQEGVRLVRQGRWTEAKLKFDEVKERTPDAPDLKEYLDRADKEIPNEQYLNHAQEVLARNKLAEVAATLAKVSADTQQHQKRRELTQALEEKIATRLVEARSALEARRYDEVVAITEDLLKAKEDREARMLLEQARAGIEERNTPQKKDDPKSPKPWEGVMNLYMNGNLATAAEQADDCSATAPRCKQLSEQIADARALIARVDDLDDRSLEKLVALDRAITDGKGSKVLKESSARIVRMYYNRASAAKSQGQYGRAMTLLRDALKVEPTYVPAQALSVEIRKKAHDVYLEAYALMRSGEHRQALPKMREVMQMTPSDDDLHRKAAARIKEMDQ
jgi:pSer/pThr/pTyr-binding forkhead associated (FHA) protein